jgi:hypothetical protein
MSKRKYHLNCIYNARKILVFLFNVTLLKFDFQASLFAVIKDISNSTRFEHDQTYVTALLRYEGNLWTALSEQVANAVIRKQCTKFTKVLFSFKISQGFNNKQPNITVFTAIRKVRPLPPSFSQKIFQYPVAPFADP